MRFWLYLGIFAVFTNSLAAEMEDKKLDLKTMTLDPASVPTEINVDFEKLIEKILEALKTDFPYEKFEKYGLKSVFDVSGLSNSIEEKNENFQEVDLLYEFEIQGRKFNAFCSAKLDQITKKVVENSLKINIISENFQENTKISVQIMEYILSELPDDEGFITIFFVKSTSAEESKLVILKYNFAENKKYKFEITVKHKENFDLQNDVVFDIEENDDILDLCR